MTCVVGLVNKGTVYIGVDSAAVQGWTRRTSRVAKVFRRGPFLIGYTTSFRMGQLLQHHLDVPAQEAGQDDVAYLVTNFIEKARALFKEKGFTKVEANTEKGGQFLVGYRGRLYTVESDFQVGEHEDGYDAIGSGADFALGAMAALPKLPPRQRVGRALEIAAHFNMGVSGPFSIETLDGPRR
jgi:ATP-dependent protease HslVU (ClpYQ) peptidase subunit